MKVVSRLFVLLVTASVLVAGYSAAIASPTALASTVSSITATSAATVAADFPRTVKDGAGNSVIVKSKPMHIVSVTLGTDEILFALVDPSRLVAITTNAKDAGQNNVVSLAPMVKT